MEVEVSADVAAASSEGKGEGKPESRVEWGTNTLPSSNSFISQASIAAPASAGTAEDDEEEDDESPDMELEVSPSSPPSNHNFTNLRPEQFGADPLYWAHLKLFTSFIANMEKVEHCTENCLARVRAVTNVHVLGVLVAVYEINAPFRFTIDDGTDLIDCLLWETATEEPRSWRRLLGRLVRAIGRVEYPRPKTSSGRALLQRRHIVLHRSLDVVTDANEELLHWLEAMNAWPLYISPAVGPAASESSAAPLERKAQPIEDLVWKTVTCVPPMPLIAGVEHLPSIQQARLRAFLETLFTLDELVHHSFEKAWTLQRDNRLDLIQAAVKRLVERGMICPVDVRVGLYSAITMKTHIVPAILSVFTKSSSRGKGWSCMEIASAARKGDVYLGKVTNARFQKALDFIVKDLSLIYQGDKKNYFLV